MPKPILLVHGSFHTESCWDLLVPRLEVLGFEIHRMTLGGHPGHEKNPYLVTMRGYGREVVQRLEQIGRPCIVLGHSMGGFAASAAAERRPELITQLIYLAAILPRYGISTMMLPPPISWRMRLALRPRLNGMVVIARKAAKVIFYNTCPPDVQEYAAARGCPDPALGTMSPIVVTRARLGTVPKDYIECTEDAALPLRSQRAMQRRLSCRRVETLASDHSPFFSMPDRLAAVIARLTA